MEEEMFDNGRCLRSANAKMRPIFEILNNKCERENVMKDTIVYT